MVRINQLSIQNITDVFQSEDGKLITIIIERKNEQITFKFNLKKIYKKVPTNWDFLFMNLEMFSF